MKEKKMKALYGDEKVEERDGLGRLIVDGKVRGKGIEMGAGGGFGK